MSDGKTNQPSSAQLFLAEFLGTGLLLLGGLSLVIFMFGTGSVMEGLIPSVTLRRIITGFIFGGWGAVISLTVIGKVSGAHINPAVTMAFWLFRKIDNKSAVYYIFGQLTGAVAGCLPLLAWGKLGRSLSFATTMPGLGYSAGEALLGEIVTTFIMVSLLGTFLAFRNLRPYTPLIFPILYAIMVPLEAGISGTSTNPARSLGPSVISGEWSHGWVYWAGPLVGAFLASMMLSRLARRITVAKLYHFDSQQDALFRRSVSPSTVSLDERNDGKDKQASPKVAGG